MANFEALIRGALAAKGASSPEERTVVYQSSRNALARLIEGNRSITVESAVVEQKSLEDAIARIEAEFQPVPAPPAAPVADEVAPTPEPAPVSEPEPTIETQPAYEAEEHPIESVEETSLAEAIQPTEEVATPKVQTSEPVAVEQPLPPDDPFLEIQQVLGVTQEPVLESEVNATAAPAQQPVPNEPIDPVEEFAQHEPAVDYQPEQEVADFQPGSEIYVDEPAPVPTGFARRRKKQRNLFWFFIVLVILGLLAWLGYRTFLGFMDGSLLGLNNGAVQSSEQKDEESSYFTIVEPGDLTALVVSDRGRVEIVNEQGLEMIRILSVRKQADRAEAAKPILLRLKPGVIEQIRGKRVTAEIFARSGKSSPAQFAIECQFGSQIGCGRKRFRVGVQPEASIFAFTMERSRDINSDAFIAISTDITDNASITGEGDILDIVYVRLRTSKQQ